MGNVLGNGLLIRNITIVIKAEFYSNRVHVLKFQVLLKPQP